MTGTDRSEAEILPKHEFVAGRLCLDFCNTLSRGPGAGPRDRIASAADFSAWAKRLGWESVPPPGPEALRGLREFRAALLAIVDATVENTVQAPADLQVLAGEIAAFRRSERLVSAADGRILLAENAEDPVENLRHAIARDAAELLLGPDRARIKRCPGPACHWVFFDASKNLSRRWCAMEDCGARDKVRRFRRRHGAGAAAP